MKKPNVATPSLRAGLNQKLIGYSNTAAVVTAGAVVLGAAATASAQITNITAFNYVSGVNFATAPSLTGGVYHGVGFSTGQGAQFSMVLLNTGGQGFASLKGNLRGDINAEFAARLGTVNVVSNVPFFQAFADNDKQRLALRNNSNANGEFLPSAGPLGTAVGYIGFRNFVDAGHHYYGWLRIKVTDDAFGHPVQVAIVDNGSGIYGAFGLASANILAGQTATAIPEPSSVATGLALFALGAVGVREHRRRKAAAAA